jgi:LysM repeat protein
VGALLASVVLIGAAPARADQTLTHRVASGETLGAIALHYGVALSQLLALNPEIDPDRLRAGQTIAVDDSRQRVEYEVQPGDTLQRIARSHELTVAEVLRWNPALQPDRIRAGQRLALYPGSGGLAPALRGVVTAAPLSRSESVGWPARGQLVHARRLTPGAGFAVREPERAWGTDETVRAVVAAFARTRDEHPAAPRVWIHDLSLRRGGRIDDHRSHQSGRDVDIAYPQKRCPAGACGFRPLSPGELDAAVTWTLLHYWLERELVEAVFIDYRLQAPLYREARARGASARELARWFQYPRGRPGGLAVIRHFPKHRDHMHVRFRCDPSDAGCRSFRPLMHAAR